MHLINKIIIEPSQYDIAKIRRSIRKKLVRDRKRCETKQKPSKKLLHCKYVQ